ncbi:MAG: hypothetical protein ABUL53_01710, partial [Bradyrhizobium guangdongense]
DSVQGLMDSGAALRATGITESTADRPVFALTAAPKPVPHMEQRYYFAIRSYLFTAHSESARKSTVTRQPRLSTAPRRFASGSRGREWPGAAFQADEDQRPLKLSICAPRIHRA